MNYQRAIKALRRRMQTTAFPQKNAALYYRGLKKILKSVDNKYLSLLGDFIDDDGTIKIDFLKILDTSTDFMLNIQADRLVSEFITQVERKVNRTMSGIPTFDVFKDNAALTDALQLATVENGDLIKTLTADEVARVKEIIYNAVRNGDTVKKVTSLIQEEGLPYKRAKFIAVDQMAKVEGAIRRARQIDAGFKYFKWTTLKDHKVRPSHAELANTKTEYGVGIYSWDDLPTIEGRKVYPGSDYHCRCLALPVLTEEVEGASK